MNSFTLTLMDCSHQHRVVEVRQFIATDASGSFGLQAGHETFLTCLQPGLARYQSADQHWHYIAQPGAQLWFKDNHLQLITSQFTLSDDRGALLQLLETQWQAEAAALGATKRNITHMEQALARKLWEMNQHGLTPGGEPL